MNKLIEQEKYKTPLCPYLVIGNGRVLVHLDAFCVPHSLYWPKPGLPERLKWRDPFDEWPYWEEMPPQAVRARMPYFDYTDGARDYLHEADQVKVDYLEDTNILVGIYDLPGGAQVKITTFVPPEMDIWGRHYHVKGHGQLVLQSGFYEKAVRGHALAHMGNVDFRGAFDAEPRGVYVMMSTVHLTQKNSHVEVPIDNEAQFTSYMCMAQDIAGAVELGDKALNTGAESLIRRTAENDRDWIARADKPSANHPLIIGNYKRWLLSYRLFTASDGAMSCGARPFWGFAWPRDCSQQIGAYAAAGMVEEARKVTQWHIDNTPECGIHEARYFLDRRPMLLDNRPRQGDNPGFLCWAAGFVSRKCWDADWASGITDNLYRMADFLLQNRDRKTLLPLPEADYLEGVIAESISNSVSAVGGLEGAAFIAKKLNDTARADNYLARADEIRQGIKKHLWNAEEKYIMRSVKPLDTVSDTAVCWGAYPFKVWAGNDPICSHAVKRVFRDRWNKEAGGVLTAKGTPYESYWMYHTGIMLLGAAYIGAVDIQNEILDSLEKNICPQGLVPEQVSRATGALWGTSPLPVAQADLLMYAYLPQNVQAE